MWASRLAVYIVRLWGAPIDELCATCTVSDAHDGLGRKAYISCGVNSIFSRT